MISRPGRPEDSVGGAPSPPVRRSHAGDRAGADQEAGRCDPFPQGDPHAPPSGVRVDQRHHGHQVERGQQHGGGHRPGRQRLVRPLRGDPAAFEQPAEFHVEPRCPPTSASAADRSGACDRRARPGGQQHRQHDGEHDRAADPHPQPQRSSRELGECRHTRFTASCPGALGGAPASAGRRPRTPTPAATIATAGRTFQVTEPSVIARTEAGSRIQRAPPAVRG